MREHTRPETETAGPEPEYVWVQAAPVASTERPPPPTAHGAHAGSPAPREATSSAPRGSSSTPAGQFGGYFAIVPHFDVAKTSLEGPGLSPGVAVALGRMPRWHASAGYLHVVGSEINALSLEVTTLGFPIPCYEGVIGVVVEPLLNLVDFTAGAGNGGAVMLWQSGFGLQAVVTYKSFYGSVSPFNARFRYLALLDDDFDPSFDLSWPIKLGAGVRF
jgi:hypothetical protein